MAVYEELGEWYRQGRQDALDQKPKAQEVPPFAKSGYRMGYEHGVHDLKRMGRLAVGDDPL